MSVEIRLPNINAASDSGKLKQMQSYMYQMVQQLNWALNTIEETKSGSMPAAVVVDKSVAPSEAENTFNSIKALIIKSADIVKAYEETMAAEFDGRYVAESDYGTFVEETNRKVEENSKGVNEVYTNVQTIANDVLTTNAYIRRGLLDYAEDGSAIYGLEVGETNDKGKFLKYARFTADRLSFFDENDYEVAYIGAGCLDVRGKTVFLGEIQLGYYKTDTSDGLAFTWIGG